MTEVEEISPSPSPVPERRRLGEPEEIARCVVFLASDDAAWITGETWHVAGGFR